MRKMSIAAGLLLGAALLGACSGGSGSAHDGTPIEGTTYDSTAWVTYAEPESVPSNNTWPERTRQLLRKATGLVERHTAELLGAYIDDEGDVVVSGTAKGAALVAGAFPHGEVTAETAPVTVESASTTGDEIRELSPGLAEAIYEWGGKPQVAGMFVSIRTDLSDDDRELLEQFAADRKLPLLVELNIGASLPSLD